MPSDEVISALAKEGIEVLGPVRPPYDEILTPDALRFVASLQRAFGARRPLFGIKRLGGARAVA